MIKFLTHPGLTSSRSLLTRSHQVNIFQLQLEGIQITNCKTYIPTGIFILLTETGTKVIVEYLIFTILSYQADRTIGKIDWVFDLR